MIVALQETTNWTSNVPNHIYFVDEDQDKLVGYVIDGKPVVLKRSMQFNRSGRTFKLIKMAIPVGIKSSELIQPKLIKVIGSKNNVYYIDPIKKTCTCPGFKYRNICRHVQEHLDC